MNNSIFLLKIYLKRILLIREVLLQDSGISDSELVKKLRNFIKLYLIELNNKF